jgi:hypothetical protein
MLMKYATMMKAVIQMLVQQLTLEDLASHDPLKLPGSCNLLVTTVEEDTWSRLAF